MVSVHRQDEKVTSPLLADREATETKQKLPRMLQNGPQREPLFLSNNPLSYWTEKVDPKGAEKGAFERAVALERPQNQELCSQNAPKWTPKGTTFSVQ